MNKYTASCLIVITAITLLIFSNGCHKDDEKNIPTVSTNPVTNITKNSAISGGYVISTNGEDMYARGVCWGKKSQPTIFDNTTNDGTGMYEYTSTMTGLEPNTTYYVRAYVTLHGEDVDNTDTGYGNEISFVTLP